MQAPGYSAYKRIQTETSSSGELILQLYDALFRNLYRAGQRIAESDREAAHDALVRAQEIVLELMTSLNRDIDSDLPTRLAELYEYMHRRLVLANTEQDIAPVHEVARLVEQLRGAWVHAVRGAASTGIAVASEEGPRNG